MRIQATEEKKMSAIGINLLHIYSVKHQVRANDQEKTMKIIHQTMKIIFSQNFGLLVF
jgi:hypothetical protein